VPGWPAGVCGCSAHGAWAGPSQAATQQTLRGDSGSGSSQRAVNAFSDPFNKTLKSEGNPTAAPSLGLLEL